MRLTQRKIQGGEVDKIGILAKFIKDSATRRFTWGTYDCVTFSLQAVGACLNKDLMAGLLLWDSEEGAKKAIGSLGNDLKEAGNAYLPTVGMIKVNSPQAGDIAIGTIRGEFIFFLCINEKTMCAFGHTGIIFNHASGEFWRHTEWEQ